MTISVELLAVFRAQAEIANLPAWKAMNEQQVIALAKTLVGEQLRDEETVRALVNRFKQNGVKELLWRGTLVNEDT